MLLRELNILLAISFITGIATLFPNCLYAWASLTDIIKESGNPCNRAASLGVIFLGFWLFCLIRISEPSL